MGASPWLGVVGAGLPRWGVSGRGRGLRGRCQGRRGVPSLPAFTVGVQLPSALRTEAATTPVPPRGLAASLPRHLIHPWKQRRTPHSGWELQEEVGLPPPPTMRESG